MSPGSGSKLARKGMLCNPGEHFNGRFEVEQKYAVDDLTEITGNLDALGAVPFALGNRETDLFFDTPDGRLAARGQQQVLRLMEPSGRVLWFVKGPSPDECISSDLEDFAKATAMLQALGYIETERISKERDIYFQDEFHLTLDRVPGLGTFVEIAIMTDDEESLPRWAARIEDLATRLGLDPASRQNASYRAMLSPAGTPASIS
jgi:adenylate cyclase class 2